MMNVVSKTKKYCVLFVFIYINKNFFSYFFVIIKIFGNNNKKIFIENFLNSSIKVDNKMNCVRVASPHNCDFHCKCNKKLNF